MKILNTIRVLLLFAIFTACLPVFAQDDPNNGKTLLRACSLTLDVNVHHPRKVIGEHESAPHNFFGS